MKHFWSILMSIAWFGCNAKQVEVPKLLNFDVTSYLGVWYEIARLDHFFERGLSEVTATYSLRDAGTISVVNRGYSDAKKKWNEASAKAITTDIPNYLKVYFVPFFGAKYQVAYVNEDYTLAVVSGGTLNYLWILSRTPQITTEQQETALGVAQAMGYDTSKLIYTIQSAP